jgi:hypothetical protein
MIKKTYKFGETVPLRTNIRPESWYQAWKCRHYRPASKRSNNVRMIWSNGKYGTHFKGRKNCEDEELRGRRAEERTT